MQLPSTLRDSLVQQLDAVISAYGSAPDPEALAGFVIEFMEAFADEQGIDDIIDTLESNGQIDGSLAEVLEEQVGCSDMSITGEEVVSITERLCDVEWDEDYDFGGEESDEVSYF
jgi:hypothetical protein